jgi:hypothetical protein
VDWREASAAGDGASRARHPTRLLKLCDFVTATVQ